ncbi:MAG: hypothetical protein J0L75_01105 [Spirochaetes bacterium]|nr:hypothetical protein [Spirochaetota bacterium]
MRTVLLLFYHALFALAYPWLVLARLPDLLSRDPRRRLRARGKLGWVRPGQADLWIHAVSGGEAVLSKTLLGLAPFERALVTTQSDTGMETLRRLYQKDGAIDPRIQIAWFPLDFLPFMGAFYRAVSPKRLLIIEHDLWPGLLSLARRGKTRTALVNASLKPRDLAWLRRFPFLAAFLYDVDHLLAPDAQTVQAFSRWPSLRDRVACSGNLKYRMAVPAPVDGPVFPPKKVVVFGSSHAPEERLCVDALAHRWNTTLLVLIPRHPERAAELARQFGGEREVRLYSGLETGASIPPRVEILIVDRMGLTHFFYARADLVLIGDTFRPSQGGHNFLEPLAHGKAVLYGAHMRSFPDLTPRFEAEGGVRRVSPDFLAETLGALLEDAGARLRLGAKGRELLLGLEFDVARFKGLLFP